VPYRARTSGVRVAALYDIHGNLPALEAVLAEVEREPADAIVFGGDIIAGPMPRQTLERVLAFGDRAHLLQGNADRIVLEFRRGLREGGVGFADAWVGEQLTDEQAEILGGLPLTVTLDVDGIGPTLFCHATPRSDEEIFTERDSDDLVAAMLEGTEERTVVCGHTHIQAERQVGLWRVVNAGSVGIAYGGVGAHWAVLGPDVELRRTDYDRGGAARLIRETGWFESGDRERKQHLVEALVDGHPKEEVLDFFEQLAATQRGA
jgi:predicted phosphodiesterase